MFGNMKVINFYNIFAVSIVVGFVDLARACVEHCTCDLLFGLKTLSCPKKNLSQFPTGIDNRTQFLRLEGNNILDIPHNLSRLLPDLRRIDLSHNKVRLLRSRIFAGLKNLKAVDLGNNEIISIEDHIFDGSETEQMNLKLRGNRLRDINEDAFRGLYADSKIDLRDNSLKRLYPNTLNGVRINTLHLSYNAIDNLPNKLFQNQDQLYFLELRENNISSLNDQIFNGLSSLETLDLSSNNLKNLPTNIFKNNKLLATLNLDSNKFTLPPFLNLPAKLKITLKNNPVICDCELKRLLSNSSFKVVVKDFNKVVCVNDSRTVSEMLQQIDCRTTTPPPPTTTTTVLKSTAQTTHRTFTNGSEIIISSNATTRTITSTNSSYQKRSSERSRHAYTTKIYNFSTTPLSDVKYKKGISRLSALILSMVTIVFLVMVGILCYIQARERIRRMFKSARKSVSRMFKLKSTYLVNESQNDNDGWIWKPGPGSLMNSSFEQ